MPATEYDNFVKTISSLSSEICYYSQKSWEGIDLNQNEPEIVKSYLLNKKVGVDYLNSKVAPIVSSSRYEVKFASVYIHSKPKIKRTTSSKQNCKGSTEGCELGDMAIVFCFLDANKNPIYCSALLSQVKKKDNLDSKSQACLYDSDISFEMPASIWKNSVINSTPIRNLPSYSEGRTKALTYTIISPSTGEIYSKFVPWKKLIKCYWGHTIERIFSGDLGLRFGGPVTQPDWNCTIHDLIQVGQGAIFSRINRGNALNDVINIFNDFNEYEKYSVELNEGGVPMMFIIVKDKEAVLQ